MEKAVELDHPLVAQAVNPLPVHAQQLRHPGYRQRATDLGGAPPRGPWAK